MEPSEQLRRVAADGAAPSDARVAAINELAGSCDQDVTTSACLWHDLLRPLLFAESEPDPVRIAAAEAAAAVGVVAVNNLCASTSPERPQIRRAIVTALRSIGRRPLPEHFEGRLAEDRSKLQDELTVFPFVNLTLIYGADERIIPILHRGLEDPDRDIRGSAVLQLARIGDMDPATHALAADADVDVRATAATAIGHYWTGEPGAIACLREAAAGADPKVAKEAKSALRRLRLRTTPEAARPPAPATSSDGEVDPRFPWSGLLRTWSFELCTDASFSLTLDEATIESGWTGADGATEDELRDLERRLGRVLPPSYRSFLQTTNGYVPGNSVSRIRPAREVRPFIEEEADWVQVWLDTGCDIPPMTVDEHIARRGQDAVHARWQLLEDTIQISDVDDGAVYLLCPTIVDDGEWEAWHFATWLPGAARFPSWWSLLNDEYRTWRSDAPPTL